MFIREYQESDCKELAEFFYNTVHTVNAKDYKKIDEYTVKNNPPSKQSDHIQKRFPPITSV